MRDTVVYATVSERCAHLPALLAVACVEEEEHLLLHLREVLLFLSSSQVRRHQIGHLRRGCCKTDDSPESIARGNRSGRYTKKQPNERSDRFRVLSVPALLLLPTVYERESPEMRPRAHIFGHFLCEK